MFIIISMIFVTRFLAKGLGPDGFGAYSLARRVVSFTLPFSTLSLGIALTRYISISDDREKRNSYLVSTMIMIVCTSFAILGVGYIGGEKLNILIFHQPKHLMLFYASVIMIVGFGFFDVLYSYYRGIQRMDLANFWQIVIMAILPLIISFSLAQRGNVSLIIFSMGLSTFICIFPLIKILKEVKFIKINKINHSMKNLFKYSIPRTPGGIFFAGLLTLGPFLAPYFGSISDAGYLVIGQSVFRILEASVVAFGLVALPKISQLYSEGKIDFLKSRISDILTMIIHLGLFIIIQIYIWSNEIVLIWLGSEYLKAVPIIKIFLISLCPYLGYVMLRSIIDAVEEKAINTLNLFISFVITAVLSLVLGYMGLGVIGLALGITLGLLTLGISSTYFLVKRYKLTFEKMELKWIFFINTLFLGITLITKKYLVTYFENIKLVIIVFLIDSLLFVFYIWLLYKRQTQWVMELKIRTFSADP